MRALCWNGINDLRVETVPDPRIAHPQDVIVQVRMSSVCGSDLHLIDGLVPAVRQGDVIGHEFTGEIVEVGEDVRDLAVGDRIVAPAVVACGQCYYCRHEQSSLCDNSNPSHEQQEKLLGHAIAGIYGYSHLYGGYPGSHAQYIRVPYAEQNAFKLPESINDEQAVFLSDAAPTGYMGADLCNIAKGSIVAVWGCGAVGQMAIQSAFILGAERVIAIDRFKERLETAETIGKAETINYEEVDVLEALRELTGGRGPDACIDAVGMEAHGTGPQYAYDRIKQAFFSETDRGQALREAILACRKGGTVSIMGVYGVMDKFPIGVALNKGLTLKTGVMYGLKYVPKLIKLVEQGRLDPSFLLTHPMRLEEAPRGYEIFKKKQDECMRAVFLPH